uniref:Uncharacterized protein n=1 Tax=Anopheles albimanus TaxID=7167 RepID=A0A182FZJ9_ANOAL
MARSIDENILKELATMQIKMDEILKRLEAVEAKVADMQVHQSVIMPIATLEELDIFERQAHKELRFPYPPFYNDPLLFGQESLFLFIITIAFFYSLQLKESMKVMGLIC